MSDLESGFETEMPSSEALLSTSLGHCLSVHVDLLYQGCELNPELSAALIVGH